MANRKVFRQNQHSSKRKIESKRLLKSHRINQRSKGRRKRSHEKILKMRKINSQTIWSNNVLKSKKKNPANKTIYFLPGSSMKKVRTIRRFTVSNLYILTSLRQNWKKLMNSPIRLNFSRRITQRYTQLFASTLKWKKSNMST